MSVADLDPRYDLLFEPVQIGPVRTKNRFYQVPHCNGMGHLKPRSVAAMREMKAEGGWGVVCTEECDIHPTTDLQPNQEARLWDDRDIPGLMLMTDAVHRHGALAGIELTHHGLWATNEYSREIPIGPSALPVLSYDPLQARAMDKQDIVELRRWHTDAAKRAKLAGFDIIYVYAAHNYALTTHFLSRKYNHRTDEYGGLLSNRARLLRELIEDTKDAVGDTCAVAVRFSVGIEEGPDRSMTVTDESRQVVEMLAELPDLWDVNVGDWAVDSSSSRFAKEGFQEPFVSFVKSVTTKPVVGVGRFTSPETMVRQVKNGVLDLIGAARPSIADPFIPEKLRSGRSEDIRECIGCNMCLSGDFTFVPFRCTQNPTIGEEYRRGWHQEKVPPKKTDKSVLVVGGGPAGLECALQLGRRGYEVMLAEASRTLGGRCVQESRLPGLAEWRRVVDYRIGQLNKLENVSIYPESYLQVGDLTDLDFDHLVVATGSTWRKDGVGRSTTKPVPGWQHPHVYSVADLQMLSQVPDPVVVFDDDHYYMGGVAAEALNKLGCRDITLLTPAAEVSSWTQNTLEQHRIQERLLRLGVKICAHKSLEVINENSVVAACEFTGERIDLPCASVVMVTSRAENLTLYNEIRNGFEEGALEVFPVSLIGDCHGPGTIAAAVYSGHKFARYFEAPAIQKYHFERELPAVSEAFKTAEHVLNRM